MKKFILISTLLFLVHTLEEALTVFWNNDSMTLWFANAFHFHPATVYWIVQGLLYLFLMFIFYSLDKTYVKILFTILGLILLFEFHHPIVSLDAGTYVSGLVSGTALSIFGIIYWAALIKMKKL